MALPSSSVAYPTGASSYRSTYRSRYSSSWWTIVLRLPTLFSNSALQSRMSHEHHPQSSDLFIIRSAQSDNAVDLIVYVKAVAQKS